MTLTLMLDPYTKGQARVRYTDGIPARTMWMTQEDYTSKGCPQVVTVTVVQ
jgi:hypothetical protein